MATATVDGQSDVEGTPPATKVRRADSILNHTTKAIEIETSKRASRSRAGA